jgi:hypothetical protein
LGEAESDPFYRRFHEAPARWYQRSFLKASSQIGFALCDSFRPTGSPLILYFPAPDPTLIEIRFEDAVHIIKDVSGQKVFAVLRVLL